MLKDVTAHCFHELLICYACLISATFESLVGHGSLTTSFNTLLALLVEHCLYSMVIIMYSNVHQVIVLHNVHH